jgi:hypothetical protein
MDNIFANADLLPLECCGNKHTRIATVFSIQSILIADFFLDEMRNPLGSSKLILMFPSCMYQRRLEAIDPSGHYPDPWFSCQLNVVVFSGS